MKDSEIDWVGQIPENWEIKKLKFTTFHRAEKILNSNLPYVGLENIEPETGKLNSINHEMEDSDAKRFLKGDVLFGKLRPYLAKVLLCDFDGRCSGEFLVLEGKEYYPGFLQFLLLSDGFIKTVDSSTYGAKMPRAEWEFIGNMKLPVLPIDSQKYIFKFLSKKIDNIERNISLSRELIRLLKEKRRTTINELVTKGLDSNIPMKNSGIKWIGNIPHHWKCTRLKHFVQLISGFPFQSEEFYEGEDGIRLVRGDNVTEGKLRWGEKTRKWYKITEDLQEFNLKENDVLIGMDGSKVGKNYAIVTMEDLPALLVQRVARLRASKELKQKFLYYLIGNHSFPQYIDSVKTNVAVPHMSPNDIQNYFIPIPTQEEQEKISEFLDIETRKIDCQIKSNQELIEKLMEYRKSLIYALVTGKIDVKEEKKEITINDDRY